MITIQGFATLCGCNTQTLRYYDRIGLLTPAKVDGWTGYRYYEEDQAMLFVKIKDLQQAGFTIEEIRILLKEDDDHILAAFDRKIEKQAQKLAQIREIQRSYLKDRMEMQNMVSMMISYVDDHLKKPGLWKEFGLDMNKETELVAKSACHAGRLACRKQGCT
jgi:Predicted transcriptional regulators